MLLCSSSHHWVWAGFLPGQRASRPRWHWGAQHQGEPSGGSGSDLQGPLQHPRWIGPVWSWLQSQEPSAEIHPWSVLKAHTSYISQERTFLCVCKAKIWLKCLPLLHSAGMDHILFKVEILSNEDREWHESFSLVLGPDDPVEAVLGEITMATVTILDQEASGSLILPATPIVRIHPVYLLLIQAHKHSWLAGLFVFPQRI